MASFVRLSCRSSHGDRAGSNALLWPQPRMAQHLAWVKLLVPLHGTEITLAGSSTAAGDTQNQMCLLTLVKVSVLRRDVAEGISSAPETWNCCRSSISLPEMRSLLLMLSLPYGEMLMLNDKLRSAPPSQPRVARGIPNTIYIPCLYPRPQKYRSFLKWLRVVTYLLDYKSKRTMYSLCFPPHTLNKKIIVQRLNGRRVCSFTPQAIKSRYQKCAICNDQSIEKGL